MLTTAQKRGILRPEDEHIAPQSMMQLNKIGADLGQLAAVRAMTDVTGFGLLGHLSEVCEGSNLTAEVNFSAVPLLAEAEQYRAQKAIPGGTVRNWDSYGHKIGSITDEQRAWLCDPQTSGGLLVCVDPAGRAEVQAVFEQYGLSLEPFGTLRTHQPDEAWIQVR